MGLGLLQFSGNCDLCCSETIIGLRTVARRELTELITFPTRLHTILAAVLQLPLAWLISHYE